MLFITTAGIEFCRQRVHYFAAVTLRIFILRDKTLIVLRFGIFSKVKTKEREISVHLHTVDKAPLRFKLQYKCFVERSCEEDSLIGNQSPQSMSQVH